MTHEMYLGVCPCMTARRHTPDGAGMRYINPRFTYLLTYFTYLLDVQ